MAQPSARQHAMSLLRWVRGVSSGFLKDFPAEKATHQPSPTDNHLAWVLGHLVITDAWFFGMFGINGPKAPESFEKLFGMGSKPTSDPKAYPPLGDLIGHFERSREALLKGLEALPDSALAVDLSKTTNGFAADGIDALLKLAWHEGWHMGQVANVRKALHLPAVMG
ncbi:MAG: DinB family protein [Phycisphaerales bacterium]|nr:DinB family protein [Phycisphaerales bacterium]